jgi:hypothetical protein
MRPLLDGIFAGASYQLEAIRVDANLDSIKTQQLSGFYADEFGVALLGSGFVVPFIGNRNEYMQLNNIVTVELNGIVASRFTQIEVTLPPATVAVASSITTITLMYGPRLHTSNAHSRRVFTGK